MKKSINDLKVLWVQQGIAPEDFLVLSLYVLQLTRTQFLSQKDYWLDDAQTQKLTTLLKRRLQKEPVAYLTGHREFFGRDFLVTAATLIPRPDSECIIEDVLTFYQQAQKKPAVILDIGTGSGILAITLRKELEAENLEVLGSDISASALEVAEKNAKLQKASVSFRHGSFLQPFPDFLTPETSLYIIANLPYVSEALLQKTEPDVRNYEPLSALVSENRGLAHYLALLEEIKGSLSSPALTCWLEISPEQSRMLTESIKSTFPLAKIFIGQDLAQRDRFLRFTL